MLQVCHLSHLSVKTVTKPGDAALDLIKTTGLLSSVSLDNVHDFNGILPTGSESKLSRSALCIIFIGTPVLRLQRNRFYQLANLRRN